MLLIIRVVTLISSLKDIMGNMLMTIYKVRKKGLEKEGKEADCLASNTANIMTKTTTVCEENDENHQNDKDTWARLNAGSGKYFYVDETRQVRRDSWNTINSIARAQWMKDQEQQTGSWNMYNKSFETDGRTACLLKSDQEFSLAVTCENMNTSPCMRMSQALNKHWEKPFPVQNYSFWNTVNRGATKHWNKEGRALLQREVWNNIDRNTTRHWNFEGGYHLTSWT